MVYPAHDYNGKTHSTIENEKNNNPRLQVKSAEEYAEIMSNLKLSNPKMMDIAVPANKKGITLQDLDKNIYAIIVKSENDEILSGKLLNLKNEAIVGVPFQKLKIGENKMKIFLINKENELHFFRDFSYNHTK